MFYIINEIGFVFCYVFYLICIVIIEYVGERISKRDQTSRRKDYASIGMKHDFILSVGSTIIDATMKGNISRFINHSCDKNAKFIFWKVNGVELVGIFAIKDIKKGDEITVDYNY